jgi:hypothetical protein
MKVEERNQDSSVTIVTMLRAKKLSEIWFLRKAADFSLSQVSTLALRPNLPPIQWISAVLSLRVKQMGCDAHHSPLSGVKVKNDSNYVSLCSPLLPLWHVRAKSSVT